MRSQLRQDTTIVQTLYQFLFDIIFSMSEIQFDNTDTASKNKELFSSKYDNIGMKGGGGGGLDR